MEIIVTCPSCRARFKVSEKFAGQTGPCPKCKQPIRIPTKSEEVVIHAPEEFGPKDSSGRAVLKPLEREETEISPVMIAGIVAAVLAVIVVAFVLGRVGTEGAGVPMLYLACGAILLGPPVAAAGYALLRDPELAPHRGSSLWIRALICGLVYAALWGLYAYVKGSIFEGEVEVFHLVFVVPALVALGGLAALVTLELDYTNGMLNYGLYLLVTGLLRLVMGMPVY
jgi:hypothetical protein